MIINYLSRSPEEDWFKPLPAVLIEEESENDERESEGGGAWCIFDSKYSQSYYL